MKTNTVLKLLPLLSFSASLVQAQSYDLFIIERNQQVNQTGPVTVENPADPYYLISSVNVTGNTPNSLRLNNGSDVQTYSYPDVNVGQLFPYFYDGFDVNESSFDLNTQQGRQGGGDVPVDWLANVEDQSTDFHQQVIGPLLLLAGDGSLPTALVSPDLNFITNWDNVNLGGKKVQAVIDVLTNPPTEGVYYSQMALTVASPAPLKTAGQADSGFSVVLVEDTFGGNGNFIQVWDGDFMLANAIPNPSGAGATFVEIFIDDPVDANPWDGTGSTDFVVRVQGQEVARYSKGNGGYTANYVTLEGSMQAAGAQLATHTVEDFEVQWGTTNSPSLPITTQIEGETRYASESALNSAAPAATYELISEAGTVGSMSLPALSLPVPQPVKEYDILQFLDPTFDLTFSWNPYVPNSAAIDSILVVDITYFDPASEENVVVWESGNTRDNPLLMGIDPATPAITIPAGTMTGSPDRNYTINFFYADVMSLETEGGTKMALDSVEFYVPVQLQPEGSFWAGYPTSNLGQSANTGEFLGWLDLRLAEQGWVFVEDLHKFIYLEESWVKPTGSWMYIPR